MPQVILQLCRKSTKCFTRRYLLSFDITNNYDNFIVIKKKLIYLFQFSTFFMNFTKKICFNSSISILFLLLKQSPIENVYQKRTGVFGKLC